MQKRFITVERLHQIAAKAYIEGGRMLSSFRDGQPRRLMEWDLSCDCENPRGVELHARYSAQHSKVVNPFWIVLRVRCRKCEWCKNMRQRFWVGRAMTEYAECPRTWMGTLTASLDSHIKLDAACRVRLAMHGVDFDGLPRWEKFEAQCMELGNHATLWIKRLRKHGLSFRYLMIAEQHDSAQTSDEMRGRPHLHLLIHESEEGSFFDGTLKNMGEKLFMPDEALPRVSWPLGFTRFEVAKDAHTAGYLCKYITKSAMVRVRASQKYGDPPSGYYILGQSIQEANGGSLSSSVKQIDPEQANAMF